MKILDPEALAQSQYADAANALRTEIGVLKTREVLVGYSKPKVQERIAAIQEVSYGSRACRLKVPSVKSRILHVNFFKIVTQILKIRRLSKKRVFSELTRGLLES